MPGVFENLRKGGSEMYFPIVMNPPLSVAVGGRYASNQVSIGGCVLPEEQHLTGAPERIGALRAQLTLRSASTELNMSPLPELS